MKMAFVKKHSHLPEYLLLLDNNDCDETRKSSGLIFRLTCYNEFVIIIAREGYTKNV